MAGLVLYNSELDESSYRVRLFLAMLGLEWKTIAVDMFPGREQTKPEMLARTPLGTMPVVEDGGLTLFGTGAILAYLAKAYDTAGTWLPDEPSAFGEVMKWLGFSETALAPAVSARLQGLFDTPGDEKALQAEARRAFRVMDDHMTARQIDGSEWFAGSGPTLADLALFPSFALSRDFGVDHDEFPALRRWIRRFRALPAFHTMPGIPDYH
ncbi:glutathione S-transferase family protein [Neorhizobium petrolearium]|uniref:glutathione S-transferase family protein n=1 Tax=Neorhizobium petrolearium TaxID=515361 RepID=UPI003F17DDC7